DQVRIKDDYLTGVGNFAQGKILISGKVTDAQKELLKHGNPVLVTEINGECNSIEPATNIGEFNFQNYYQAKQIYQKLKYSSCQMKLLPITDFGRSEEHTSELQSRFDLVCRLLLEKKKQ